MSKQRTEANGSKNNEWETPEYIYNILNYEFNFNWDLACISKNCKTEEGCMTDKGFNGLNWVPEPNKEYRIWCNPPYSIQLKPKFIERCYELSKLENVKEVVMLIPSTTETKHFHEIMIQNCEIRFIHKRVKFKGINTKGKYVTDKTGQSGSMVVVFNRKPKMCIFREKKKLDYIRCKNPKCVIAVSIKDSYCRFCEGTNFTLNTSTKLNRDSIKNNKTSNNQ